MEQENCLNCKYVAYVLINTNEPEKSLFYCMMNEMVYMNTNKCGQYQKSGKYYEEWLKKQ